METGAVITEEMVNSTTETSSAVYKAPGGLFSPSVMMLDCFVDCMIKAPSWGALVGCIQFSEGSVSDINSFL